MKSKKYTLLVLVLALALTLNLSGCGGSNEEAFMGTWTSTLDLAQLGSEIFDNEAGLAEQGISMSLSDYLTTFPVEYVLSMPPETPWQRRD